MRLSALRSYFPKQPHYGLEDAVYRAFLQAYCLHPNLYVARRVVLEAMAYLEAVALPRHRQRPQAATPYRLCFPPQALSQASTLWELFQISIFDVSEMWEMDQESPPPQREPEYRPTASVLLTRFVKHLAFITMVRTDSYPMAVAVGSCLFTCTPSDACRVVNLIASKRLANIDRVKRQILRRRTTRFRHLLKERELRLKALKPDEAGTGGETSEWNVVKQAMDVFTPWETTCFQASQDVCYQVPEDVDLDPDEESQTQGHNKQREEWKEWSERQRLHALLCSVCAGFRKLVTQWNASTGSQLSTMLEIPVFPPLPASSNADDHSDPPTHADDHFDPPVPDDFLNDLRISITNILKTSAQRRRAQPFELFRVCADGVELGRFGGASQTTQDFRIPADTMRVQVFGQDREGDVPLSVFYLPDPDDDYALEPLYHVTESGATLALTVSPADTAETSQIQLAFWPEESLVPKNAAWDAAAVATACRSLELAQITGDAAREADMRHRLRRLHRSMSAFSAQGGELAALAERLGQWLAELPERVTQWVSELWTPQWAGVLPVAAATPEDAHTFALEEGEITVTCRWGAADQRTAAYIDLLWEADFAIAGDIWVQFRQPDTGALLVELRLGTDLSGEASFTHDILGFDPSGEPWGLAVMLKEVSS